MSVKSIIVSWKTETSKDVVKPSRLSYIVYVKEETSRKINKENMSIFEILHSPILIVIQDVNVLRISHILLTVTRVYMWHVDDARWNLRVVLDGGRQCDMYMLREI